MEQVDDADEWTLRYHTASAFLRLLVTAAASVLLAQAITQKVKVNLGKYISSA
jgi:hypothetical protein